MTDPKSSQSVASFAILLIAYLSLNSSLNLLNKVSSDKSQM